MSSTTTHSSSGISFFSLLAIVFITLKLTGHITWSWWWVTVPLWGPVIAFLAFAGACLAVAAIAAVTALLIERFA